MQQSLLRCSKFASAANTGAIAPATILWRIAWRTRVRRSLKRCHSIVFGRGPVRPIGPIGLPGTNEGRLETVFRRLWLRDESRQPPRPVICRLTPRATATLSKQAAHPVGCHAPMLLSTGAEGVSRVRIVLIHCSAFRVRACDPVFSMLLERFIKLIRRVRIAEGRQHGLGLFLGVEVFWKRHSGGP